jgi:cell wall-associated NlpC family hydrolase
MRYLTYLLILFSFYGCIFTKTEENKQTTIPNIVPSLKLEKNISDQKKIVNVAKNLVGVRYRYGGADPYGFDCSGFVNYVYKSAIGKKLPRTSKDQSNYGVKVKKSDLQIGDILFFDTSRKRRGRVNHSGIYIGNGKFVHSSSGKIYSVTTSFLNKGFYKNRFLWARRIVE